MTRDINGYIKFDDRDYWTFVEMQNKFIDENHRSNKENKEKSNKINRPGPRFRRCRG